MRLNSHRFNRFLNHVGQDVAYRRARSCSCYTTSSSAPSTTCKLCAGKGKVWAAPVETVLATHQEQPQIRMGAPGAYMDGDLIATIPNTSPVWGAGLYDRITLRDATEAFSVYLIRGHVSERLLFEVVEVHEVFWKNATTQALVPGGIPTINENGVPVFTEKAPPAGTTYSITGTRRPEYFVARDLPSSRGMHSGEALPKRLQLRRWDLFGR